jgi:hypothetical protein
MQGKSSMQGKSTLLTSAATNSTLSMYRHRPSALIWHEIALPLTAMSLASVAVMPWLRASLKLDRERAYRDQHGTIITNGTQLGDAYQTSNAALINTQLILAGQRLANLINQLADGSLTVANIPQRVFGE